MTRNSRGMFLFSESPEVSAFSRISRVLDTNHRFVVGISRRQFLINPAKGGNYKPQLYSWGFFYGQLITERTFFASTIRWGFFVFPTQ